MEIQKYNKRIKKWVKFKVMPNKMWRVVGNKSTPYKGVRKR